MMMQPPCIYLNSGNDSCAASVRLNKLVQQCWTPPKPISHKSSALEESVDEAKVWKLDCNAFLSILYLRFSGGRIEQNLVELHCCQFMIKWFGTSEDLLVTASSVHNDLWTQSFVSSVLLYALVLPAEPLAFENFFKSLLCRPEPAESHPPEWLAQMLDSENSYLVLLKSLLGALNFIYNLQKLPRNWEQPSKTQSLLEAFKLYHECGSHKLILDTVEQLIDGPECICDPALRACALWLKGLVAQDNSCYTLATACYRDALASWPRLSHVIFNAYQAYERQGITSAAMNSLQLFLRGCVEAGRSDGYESFSASLLRAMLPKPSPTAARALLMAVSTRNQGYTEALEHYSALQNEPSWASEGVENCIGTERRLLLPAHLTGPQCPPRAALRSLAAIAAFKLQKIAQLEELLAADLDPDHIDATQYYESSCKHQLSILARLFRSVMRVESFLLAENHSSALKECASMVTSTMWVVPALPADHPCQELMLLAPLLIQTLVYSHLASLHLLLNNTMNANHFKRLSEQNYACLQDFRALNTVHKQSATGRSSPKNEWNRPLKRKYESLDFDSDVDFRTERGAHARRNNHAFNVHEQLLTYCDLFHSDHRLDESSLVVIIAMITFISNSLLCSQVRK
ncbi:uncharacterized protein LOC108680896 isoform X2 [Hyalella azteca]|uniref:Uncharacterized protein LOC108680896 isoform X2 n=1 Tax=Hyalella azteca TaxID=294128 RepID=A0A979FJP9_HYAAZ|nr:uncharacterized protein LOC108680896 isoform X2 [Hyalella azteca]